MRVCDRERKKKREMKKMKKMKKKRRDGETDREKIEESGRIGTWMKINIFFVIKVTKIIFFNELFSYRMESCKK